MFQKGQKVRVYAQTGEFENTWTSGTVENVFTRPFSQQDGGLIVYVPECIFEDKYIRFDSLDFIEAAG